MLLVALAAVGITAVPAASAPALLGGQRPVQLRTLMRRFAKYTAQARSRQADAKAGVGQVCCRWKIDGQLHFEFKQEDCYVAGSTEFSMIPVNGGCDEGGFTAFFPPKCASHRGLWSVYVDMLGSTRNNKEHMERTAKEVVDRLCPVRKVEGPTMKKQLEELKRQRAEAEEAVRAKVRQVNDAKTTVMEQQSRISAAIAAHEEAEKIFVQRSKEYGDATRVRGTLDSRIAELEQ